MHWFYKKIMILVVSFGIIFHVGSLYSLPIFAAGTESKVKPNKTYNNDVKLNTDTVFTDAYQFIQENKFEAALSLVKKTEETITQVDQKRQGIFHSKAAQFYASIGNFEAEAEQWKKLYLFMPDKSDTLYALVYKYGRAHLNAGDWNMAFEAFESCKLFAESVNDQKLLAAAYDGMATVLGYQADYEKAVSYHLKSIGILEKTKFHQKHAQGYSNLAVLYLQMEEINKAYEARKKAYDISLLTNNEYSIHKALFGLGSSYNDIGKPDSAINLLEKTLEYFETNYNPRFLNGAYTEIGRSYSELKNHPKARWYFLKSIEMLRQGEMALQLAGTLLNYGQVLNKSGLYGEAITSCLEALQLAKALKMPEMEAAVCECLYNNYKVNKQADSALFYLELQLALEDSIRSVEVEKAILTEELSSSYNKEKENIISEATTEINAVSATRNLWIAGFIGLLLLFIGFYYVYIQKKKVHQSIDREKQYLDNLLHNLVHEFRTPLTLIKGPAEELLKNDTKNDLLKMIDKNSDQMLVLINQILDFAKIKAGRLEIFEQPTQLELFYTDTIALFKPTAEHKKITITLNHQSRYAAILVDSDKLFKILSNLLSNAIKYSEPSTNIVIDSKINKQELILKVIDEGIGISENDQKKVFEKFYQADATITRKGEGTGLGLAFTKELVNLMQGSITLLSKLGKGTTIGICLPINFTADQSTAINESKEEEEIKYQKNPTSVSEEQYKILIIEDNIDMQTFLSQVLKAEQYEIYAAYDGEAGVKLALEVLPDLIISDVMMPKMDGFQVTQSLKSNKITDHIPILILTAKVSFDSMIEGLRYGADDYLSKPFKAQELLLRVANQINRQEKLRIKHQTIEEGSSKEKHHLIKKIEALTLDDTSQHFSVDDLAEKCALSRSQLHRKLKQLTGLSTTEFLTNIRMNAAYKTLKSSDLSISEIAYQFGYSDPAHFSKLFKKQFNETPSEARK